MLKKTNIITIITCIVNSTYTISYLIGVRPVLISIDPNSRAALDNRKGKFMTLPRMLPPKKPFFLTDKKKLENKT